MSSLKSIELQKLYIAFFGRPCDPSGMNYWLSKINEKVNLIDISKSLSLQEEYKQNLISSNSIEAQINQIYCQRRFLFPFRLRITYLEE